MDRSQKAAASIDADAKPAAAGDFKKNINPHSLEVVTAKCEPSLRDWRLETCYQFERLGYFAIDPDSGQSPTTGNRSPIFNRTITLKDTWAKIEKKGNQ
ncbi:MAG: Glutamine--tRNA ligase [Verrucomicrobiae bacterium]|nr:Glutamine--tRNA ligase [Verrucomicrobiae bacterium]